VPNACARKSKTSKIGRKQDLHSNKNAACKTNTQVPAPAGSARCCGGKAIQRVDLERRFARNFVRRRCFITFCVHYGRNKGVCGWNRGQTDAYQPTLHRSSYFRTSHKSNMKNELRTQNNMANEHRYRTYSKPGRLLDRRFQPISNGTPNHDKPTHRTSVCLSH
jgi:hypothetical protein